MQVKMQIHVKRPGARLRPVYSLGAFTWGLYTAVTLIVNRKIHLSVQIVVIIYRSLLSLPTPARSMPTSLRKDTESIRIMG